METEIKKVIKYFLKYDYPPDLKEIHCFYPEKTNKTVIKHKITELQRKRKIIKLKSTKENIERYTLPEYGIKSLFGLKKKLGITRKKLEKWQFVLFLRLISLFPQILMVGLSGSVSMNNAYEGDDIDLFIITAENRLFTGRFLSMMIAQLFGSRRSFSEKKVKDKICLNLFFDRSNMAVPKEKQTIFVGHEMIQMKPIIDKEDTYSSFMRQNPWVYEYFPNLSKPKKSYPRKKTKKNSAFSVLAESVLKKLQMVFISKHKTTELITDTQLWFHPEKKLE